MFINRFMIEIHRFSHSLLTFLFLAHPAHSANASAMSPRG